MPRKPRIEYGGAVYHLMSRGDRGQPIYRDDRDRQRFLETLEEACLKTGWRIHAYVLMGNHYHLMAQTPEPNLVAGMKWLQGTFTQRFNARHRQRGHLFQGRYRSCLVEAEGDYFGVLSTYIHLNPVRAGLIKVEAGDRLRDYRWSSYPHYLSGKGPSWLELAEVFRAVGAGANDRGGRRRYQAYVESRALEVRSRGRARKELEAEWRAVRRGWFLGDEEFRDGLAERLGRLLRSRRKESLSGEAVGLGRAREAEGELQRALALLDWEDGGWRHTPKGSPEKAVLAWWLRRRTIVDRRWVAERLAMGYPTRVTAMVQLVQSATRGSLARLRKRLERGAES